MRAWGILFALTLGVMTAAAGAQTPANADAEKAEIAKAIHASIAWALTKDRALLERTMVHDGSLTIIWTHSGGSVTGWDNFSKLFKIWMDPRFKATVTDVRDLKIFVSRSGDAAWFSATLDDFGEWDGEVMGAKDIRWTGVLEKRDGRWVIVQSHGSLAADKVEKEAKKPG